MNDISIEALKLRERELELDAVMIRGRVEEIRNIIAHMERRRGGRPRKQAGIVIIPQRVAGAAHQPEPERDEDGELPSIDDVRGILKENVG